jgi:hypothetical protein
MNITKLLYNYVKSIMHKSEFITKQFLLDECCEYAQIGMMHPPNSTPIS